MILEIKGRFLTVRWDRPMSTGANGMKFPFSVNYSDSVRQILFWARFLKSHTFLKHIFLNFWEFHRSKDLSLGLPKSIFVSLCDRKRQTWYFYWLKIFMAKKLFFLSDVHVRPT